MASKSEVPDYRLNYWRNDILTNFFRDFKISRFRLTSPGFLQILSWQVWLLLLKYLSVEVTYAKKIFMVMEIFGK